MSNRSANTKKLMRMLSDTDNIKEFLDKHKKDMINHDLTTRVNNLRDEKGLSVAQIVKRSGMSQSYCYQVFKGQRQPSRDKIIQLGIGLRLSLSEMNDLLRLANKANLYCKHIRDAIIIYAFNNKLDIFQLEDLLYEKDLKLFTDR